ncbi:putative Protein FAM185A [Hypsibius exemplaris]|uniref:DUF4097 domain-containing protein n=1 Tax=Hypsibius exemplaris TaxID=2072580 RepID=A0A1W0WH74_HYPEX|nr:putative Protein FAM185A [Hypsibius exemplaris]
MFLRATATRRMPERILDKLHSKLTEFKVFPFGLLQLRVSDCSPKVVPLDYDAYPDGDKVVISHCAGCHVDRHRMDFFPTKRNDPEVLSLSCVNSEHAEYCGCIVRVPNQMSLDISASGDADVKVSSLEPAQCHISSDYSSVHLHKVKTGKATIFANNGSVEVTGSLIGNISIKTGVAGFVRADRLQGSQIKIDTFRGPIDCQSIYGESVQLSSREGAISTKNLHGDVKIWTTGGDVNIGSLEGNLELSTGRGSSTINVANSQTIKIHAMDGDVSLGLADSIKAQIMLESPNPISAEDVKLKVEHPGSAEPGPLRLMGVLNDATPLDTASVEVVTTKGSIALHATSWLSSLKLGFREDKVTDRI